MLRLEDVGKSYGTVRVLERVNLSVDNGTSLRIAGRSGCGKSTLLKLMALISVPDAGSVFISGKEVTGSNPKERDSLRSFIGYSFQEPLLLPYLSAIENIVDVISRSKSTTAGREEAQAILSKLGLSERLEHLPSKLSVGEKKRVDIARALFRKPAILVLDEPFSNLDPGTGGLVSKLLRNYVQSGGTLVYSSVNLREGGEADKTMDLTKESN
jgi:ABC-type lipoprotein export system ATPase subunit